MTPPAGRPDMATDDLPVTLPRPAADGPRPGPRVDTAATRRRVLEHLRAQGFAVNGSTLLAPVAADKDGLRRLHAAAAAEQRERSRPALARHEPQFLARLADPADIVPADIDPVLVPVGHRRSFDALTWRWCALHWNVPVSAGYGRRMRFLVVDRAHRGAVMGIIGLGDPVFALKDRDSWIGWDAERRRTALANVMDAFALGAVPPYTGLRGAKLAGLLAVSDTVRDEFRLRYAHKKTRISGRDPDADLVLVTTASAFGRSSAYNRLTGPDRRLAYLPVGYTNGTGDFHLTGPVYDELAACAAAANPAGATHASPLWKSGGPRNRREVVQRGLAAVGLDGRALRLHGIRRQVFVAPTVNNPREVLACGEQPDPRPLPAGEAAGWWRSRWAVPRAASDETWREFRRCDWALWPD